MHHFRFTVQHNRRLQNRRLDRGRFWNLLLVFAVAASTSMLGGCEEKTSQRLTTGETPGAPVAVRSYRCTVLLVGHDRLADSIERQWSARQDADFELKTISIESFAANDFKINPDTDVVIYPSSLLMELIHRGRIVELHRSVYDSESFNRKDLLTHFRKSGIRYDSKTWAVPCGSPLFAMIYQPQSLSLAGDGPPQTWKQLVRWSERLAAVAAEANNTKASNTASNTSGPAASEQVGSGGVGVPLAEGWAAKTFIAMAAPAVRQKGRLSVMFDRRTMKPLIVSNGFIEALEQLKRLAEHYPTGFDQTPADVLQDLIAGKLAAGITWPTAAGTIFQDAISRSNPANDGGIHGGTNAGDEITGNDDSENESTNDANPSGGISDAAGTLVVGELPGSETYYDVSAGAWGTRRSGQPDVVNFHGLGGVLASQVKQSRRPRSAIEFLKWVSESSISQTLFAGDPDLGPFRFTHLADPKAWLGDRFSIEFENDYASHLKQAHQHALIMTMPNILKRQQYIEILDREIRDYLRSDRSAKETLQSVARQWEELTTTIGRKVQSNILRRNSNF